VWKRLLILAVAAVLAAGGGAYFWAKQAIVAPGPGTVDTRVIIERGSGLNQIAWQLHREGVIAHPRLFLGLAQWRGLTASLKAGEYLFPAGISLEAALGRIARGEVEIHTLTIPEGLTSHAILELLAATEGLTGDLPDDVAEGSLLPSTYDYLWGVDRGEIVRRMQAAMAAAVAEAWEARAEDLPIESPEDLVTLASIVEKETGLSDERAEVAGVFVNRLRLGMKLQSDPTTIYAVTGGKGTLGRGLRRSELAKASPYNTYRIDGLPPGPIANPGKGALMAVAQPAETDALFFVADGSGGHAFATTLAEHRRNVARWRKIERERKAQQ
tara:strand:- start:537 stop:1520 length:984 start_codon:yes stop_codon:yes gene_type:complete